MELELAAEPLAPLADGFSSAEGRARLAAASVLIVGAGGLGTPAVLYLAAAGVGKLTLLDDDVIEATNLARQILYAPDDLAKSKAEVVGQKLAKQFPECGVFAHRTRLVADNAADFLSDADLVLDASDNLETRLVLNDTARATATPLITGAIGGTLGILATILPSSPCYRCLLVPRAAGSETAGGEPPRQPVLGALAGMIGAMMANEALKFLLFGSNHTLAGKLLLMDSLTGSPQLLLAESRPSCLTCGKNP